MKSAAFVTYAFLFYMVPARAFSLADTTIIANTGHSSSQQTEESFEWDFGKIKAGDVVKHEFRLKNDSARPLRIISVSTSCGCTASKAKKDLLAAGESCPLEVSFNSRGYSGAVRQFIYVATDAIDKSVIRYIIKAEVVK